MYFVVPKRQQCGWKVFNKSCQETGFLLSQYKLEKYKQGCEKVVLLTDRFFFLLLFLLKLIVSRHKTLKSDSVVAWWTYFMM